MFVQRESQQWRGRGDVLTMKHTPRIKQTIYKINEIYLSECVTGQLQACITAWQMQIISPETSPTQSGSLFRTNMGVLTRLDSW